MSPLLVALTIAACLSPLLTFAHLWQIKEWRIDRMREHLRSEGWLTTLFGRIRPIIVVGGILFMQFSVRHILTVLTALNIIQIIIKKQKFPVWTQKAITLAITSFLFDIAVTFLMLYFTRPTASGRALDILLIFLPLLQPFVLFLSWILWLPVDHMLKRHTLEEAKTLRAEFPDLTVIGITGSVGKTTTKELLAHILADFHPLVTPAYVNTEMGVAQWFLRSIRNHPSTPLRINSGVRLVIVEMGAYRKGEIRMLCEIVQPTIGVITAIGTQHLGLFGSRETIAEAKGELFQALPKNGQAFIPEGTPFIDTVVSRATCHVQRVSSTPRASIALASAVARHLGLSPESIQQRITSFTPPPHTFFIRTQSGVTILDDTHNVSPESFQGATEWASSQPHKQKILITPGIIELGTEESTIHKQLGIQASPIFDRVIVLSKRHAKMFERGYGRPVELYSKNSSPVPQGSLLVCIGRMSNGAIKTLLP